MRNGKGTYYFGEKDHLKGIWKNNLPHGEGTLTYKDKKIQGEFRFGKLILEKSAVNEGSSSKKNKKGKKSSDDGKHKHKHSHNKSHSKSQSKISKTQINDEKEKSKNKSRSKTKNEESNSGKPVEIDGIPGICVKKMK
jgi:hypothetical protein